MGGLGSSSTSTVTAVATEASTAARTGFIAASKASRPSAPEYEARLPSAATASSRVATGNVATTTTLPAVISILEPSGARSKPASSASLLRMLLLTAAPKSLN